MTPGRCKIILPSSNDMLFADGPPSAEWWHAVLRYVQCLYLKGRHKQTLLQCQNFLNRTLNIERPELYTTYLNFYAAISTEALARAAHPFSIQRLENLKQAAQYYEAAEDALPVQTVSPDSENLADTNINLTEGHFETIESDDASTDNRRNSDRTRTSYSASSLQSDGYIADTMFPKPPSARSSRSPTLATFQEGLSPNRSMFSEQLSPKSSTFQASELSPPQTRFQARQQSLAYTSVWLRERSAELYNAHLADFQGLLTRHLGSIDSLIGSTKESQATRHTTRRFASYGDDEEAKAADLRTRVQRLKANGWSRERFRPGHYEELCEQALADL